MFAPSLKSEKWCLLDQCPNSHQQKLNLLVIYCFFVSIITMTGLRVQK